MQDSTRVGDDLLWFLNFCGFINICLHNKTKFYSNDELKCKRKVRLEILWLFLFVLQSSTAFLDSFPWHAKPRYIKLKSFFVFFSHRFATLIKFPSQRDKNWPKCKQCWKYTSIHSQNDGDGNRFAWKNIFTRSLDNL